jgi:hypothetical protein
MTIIHHVNDRKIKAFQRADPVCVERTSCAAERLGIAVVLPATGGSATRWA